MLLDLSAWCSDHFPGKPIPMSNHPLKKNPFSNIQPKPSLTQLQAVSSSPVPGHYRVCPSSFPHEEAIHFDEVLPQSPPGWRDLSYLLYNFPSKPFTDFVVLLWTCSNNLIWFLYCGAQNCQKNFRQGFPSAEQSGKSLSLFWLIMLCLMLLWTQLALLAARALLTPIQPSINHNP